MINILRFLFLFFLYFSNVSTLLSIYPILYNLIAYTKDSYKWYYFGIVFSIYELGKFFGIILWEKLSYFKSNITLILISLFLISLLNISFGFISELFHIIIIRFLLGFCNNIGTFFKNIYIQMGFKKNNKIIIFLISIICTANALFLPSIIIFFDLGEKIIKIKSIKMKNIMLIYILLAISNILSIVFGSILILKNKLRINSGFYQMNNPEKTENSIDGPFKPSKNDLAESEQKSDNKIIKVKNVISDANINIINQNKFNNENDPGTNKDGKISYNKNGLTKIDGGVSLQVFQPNNQNIIFNTGNNRNEISQSKDFQFCIIQTLININDGLNLIWTLIVLYNRFEEKCLSTSIYLSLLKLLGEVVLFPINQYITKNSSISLFLKIIPKRMKIINIFLLCSSILISQTIFSIYYYSNISDLLMKLFFLPLFLRNILSGIFTQFYKIYNNNYFKQNNLKSINLKKYNQYLGSLSKAIIYIIGSIGILIIEIIYNKENSKKIIISLTYLHLIPIIFYIILFIACIKFII